MAENILTVENLNIAYQGVPAVMDVNFTLERGKVLTIVGESGSGKTTVIRALMGLLPVGGEVTEGSMIFNGHDLRNLSKSEWRSLRGKDMAMIFQDSGSALDPIVRIGKQFRELFKSHIEIDNDECDRRAIALLEAVSLPNGADILRRYPHELSGGQRQRVGIAMALALDPALLIGDEPTSALDVTTQSQVVMKMLELKKEHNSAIVMVTHNLGVAAYMSDYIIVMKKVLGALMAHGIQPGFKIFTASGDLAYTFIMSQFAVNLLMIPVGFVLCQCMARLLSIRLTLVAIGIVVLAFIGAYAISNSLVDIWVVLAFGLVGFFGGKVGMDTGAMALGVILGPMIEENLGKSVDLSRSVDGGLMSVMFEGSINKVLIAALLLSLLTPFLLKLRNRKHAALLPEGPRPGWKTDLFAGIGFLAIAAAFLVQYEGLEGVSRVFPEVLTKLIGAGGAYFVGKGLWRRSREAAEPEGGEAVAWCKIGIICATSLCYAVLIPVFGFLVTTMGFIAGSTLILGDHSRGLPRLARTAIAFAIGFSLLVWAGFTLLLNVPVPEGMFL